MAKIKYVGLKPETLDCVAGTNTVWTHPGDVREVKDLVAVAKLLQHPDMWVLVEADAEIEAEIDAAKLAIRDQKKGKYEDDEFEEQTLMLDVNRLTMDSLVVFAKREFNLELDRSKTLGELRTVVQRAIAQGATAARNGVAPPAAKPVGKARASAKAK